MSWLLGIGDALRPGAAPFVVFDTALIFGSLSAFVVLGRGGWGAALVAALFVITPQLLIYPAIVWKDVLFAGAATGGFACLAWMAAAWARPTARYALLAKGLVLLSLATLARQNGAVVLPFAAAAVGWIAARAEPGPALRRGLVHGVGVLGAGGLIVLAASAALATRGDGAPAGRAHWEDLQTYDLAGALSRYPRPDLDLGVLHAQAPDIEALLKGPGVDAYTPSRIDPLAKVLDAAHRRDANAGLIAAEWKDLIVRRPLLYLRMRASVFKWVLLTPDADECLMVSTGVDGAPEDLRAAGIVARETRRDDALADYAAAFIGTPVLSHLAYALVGLAALIVLLRRRKGPDIAVAAMLGAAFTFTASFAVLSVACDYRYLYDLDIAVMAAALYLAATSAIYAGVRASRPRR
jgi:hypothetical protein